MNIPQHVTFEREGFMVFSFKGKAVLFLGQNQNKEKFWYICFSENGERSHFLSSSKICS